MTAAFQSQKILGLRIFGYNTLASRKLLSYIGKTPLFMAM